MHRFAVGGQEEQAGGHHVEPPHVGEAGMIGQEVEDGATALFITRGGDDAQRLVEGEPPTLHRLHGSAADRDALALGIHLHAQRRHLPVHPDPSALDQLFGRPA